MLNHSQTLVKMKIIKHVDIQKCKIKPTRSEILCTLIESNFKAILAVWVYKLVAPVMGV